jgi:hypothetical protein
MPQRTEEVFGWTKGAAGLIKVKLRGRARAQAVFTLALSDPPARSRHRHDTQGQVAHRRDAGLRGRLSRYDGVRLYRLRRPRLWRVRLRLRNGQIWGAGEGDVVEFSWDGNDQMDEANGDGWAELRPDGSLQGEVRFHRGDEATFFAKPWGDSSTAC